MARKPKTDLDAPGTSAALAAAGDNKLTDDELRALAFQHKQKYEEALAVKKKADADFKNTCKAAKAEMGKGAVETIKDMIALDGEGGEQDLRDEMLRKADALRWMGFPLGTQLEMTLGETDRTPAVDRAFDEGKRASMQGNPAKPDYAPGSPQQQAYLNGYADHQKTLLGQVGRGEDSSPESVPF